MRSKLRYVIVWAVLLGVIAYIIRSVISPREYTYRVDEEGRTRISREDAKIVLYAGQVEQVSQLHSQDVILELKSGEEFWTKEPSIDLISREIQQCGVPCRGIVQAIE